MCSFPIMPTTSSARGTRLDPRTTTAMMAPPRHMRSMTSKRTSSSRAMVKFFFATLRRICARLFAFEAMAQRRVDALHAHNAVPLGNDDVLHTARELRMRKKFFETQACGEHERTALHNVAGMPDQEHVGVKGFRHKVAAADKLDGINVFAGQD